MDNVRKYGIFMGKQITDMSGAAARTGVFKIIERKEIIEKVWEVWLKKQSLKPKRKESYKLKNYRINVECVY